MHGLGRNPGTTGGSEEEKLKGRWGSDYCLKRGGLLTEDCSWGAKASL